MITINLAKRLKSGVGAGGKIDLKNLDLKQLLSFLTAKKESSPADGKKGVLASPIGKAILAAGTVYFLQDTIETWKKEELEKLDKQIQAVEKDNTKLRTGLNKYANFETRKAQFETEITTLKTKLEVLNKLMEGRSSSSKMMLELSKSIPSDVWLTDFRVGEKDIAFTGQTASYPSVSEFMKTASSSRYFGKVNLKGIQEIVTQKDIKVQEFTISAERKETM